MSPVFLVLVVYVVIAVLAFMVYTVTWWISVFLDTPILLFLISILSFVGVMYLKGRKL